LTKPVELPQGQPVTTEGAVPLGIFAGAEPSVMRFTLEHEDRLVLASDGIVEAMNASGQLFGFERVQALLNKQVTAVEVADAAENFGQEDDISVFTVARTAVLEPALV
jgi:serine phosphatase RsbU (regulator of sigma subunit)